MEETKKLTNRRGLIILVIGAVFVVSVSVVFAITRPSFVNKTETVGTLTSTSATSPQNLQRIYCEIPSEGFPKTFGRYDYRIEKTQNFGSYDDLLHLYKNSNDALSPTVIQLDHEAIASGTFGNLRLPKNDVLSIVWGNCKYDLDLAALGISNERLGEMYINNKQQLFFLQYDEHLTEGHTLPTGEYVYPDLDITAYKINLKTKKVLSKNLVPFPTEIVKFPGNGDQPKYSIWESYFFEPTTSKIFISVGYFDGCFGEPSCMDITGYTEKMFENVDKNIGAYEYNFETNKLERKTAVKHFNKDDNSIFMAINFDLSADLNTLYVREQRESLKKF